MFETRDAVPMTGPWQDGTVVDIRPETERVKTLRVALPDPTPYLAGQHFLVRLTAPDGYRAQRSYSVAIAPGDPQLIELTVERLPDGEVSMFLHDELMVGDMLEVRGPIGGWFVWPGDRPALLVGGGTGVVPLMAMLRLARRTPEQSLAHLIASVRTPDDLIYAPEMAGADVTVIYTRATPDPDGRAAGRITVADVTPLMRPDATVFVCGSASFAEGASTVLVDAGVDPENIRVERFGPTR